MNPYKPDYCATCGLYLNGKTHACSNANGEPEWCEYCGAELRITGSCDNPHDEEE